jgi:hypothetical protein
MTIKLSEISPVIAQTLGWDCESMINQDLVTMVRKRLIIEETVISRKEFDELNKQVETDEFYWNELDWKDAQWSDYCEENTTYCAYQGDVTSFTDDIVAFMYPEAKWVECFENIECVIT